MAKIHLNHYHGGNSADKGLFKHHTTLDMSQLQELVEQGIKDNIYFSITPPSGLSEEFAKDGDILVFFDDKRLVSR